MGASYLEHLNLTVVDIDRTIRFLRTAMPEFEVRGTGADNGGTLKRWVHLGTETSYVAIEDRGAQGPGPHEAYVHPGVNHIGFVVEDADEVAERLRSAGYREKKSVMTHPHRKRIYFLDEDGIEYEFIQYLSEKLSERNDYDL